MFETDTQGTGLAKATDCLHFCLFEIDGNKLTLKVIDDNGAIIDRLELTKTKGILNSEYIETAITMESAHAVLQEIINKSKS